MFYTIVVLCVVIYKQHTYAQTPSNSYLAPLAGNNPSNHFNNQGPSKGYGSSNGPSSNGNGGQQGNDGNSNEPAKYEFQYEVNDAEQGTMFGHSESRDGDLTQGEYNVLLPDGRKQIVTYTADLEGYHPEIRYEGEAMNSGGGGGGTGQGQKQGQSQGNFNGYPSKQQSGPY